MKYGSLQEYIEGLEYSYCVTNTRESGENSAKRGGHYLRIVYLIMFMMF